MIRAFATLVCCVLLVAAGLAQEVVKYTVLDKRHAMAVLHQCSRPVPEKVTGTWQPSESNIRDLEMRLSSIAKLQSTLCCNRNARVGDVNSYYRQYVGIVLGNRRVIYINAFAADAVDRARPRDVWRSRPMLACDGGESFWGAVYDPETKEFSQLAFNGEA